MNEPGYSPPIVPNRDNETPVTNLEKQIDRYIGSDDRWILVAAGICLAGAAYPIVILAIFGTIGLVAEAAQALREPASSLAPWLLALYPAMLLFVAIGAAAGCLGAIWAGFLSVMIVPIFYLFVRSLRLRTDIVWLGAMCGGLVGFVAILPMVLRTPFGTGAGVMDIVLIAILGPCLTTVLGQLGGAWGGKQSADSRNSRVHSPAADASSEPILQFRIRHLLWLTVWISLLLTSIRLSGIPFELLLPVLLAWLMFQAGTLACGWYLFRRVVPKWTASGDKESSHPRADCLPRGK